MELASTTMKTVHVDWLGGLMFDGVDSGGMPVDIDGRQERGAKPSDLLPLALASCSGYDVVVALGDSGTVSALSISVSYRQQPDPPWAFTRFKLHYSITGSGFDNRQVAKAIEHSIHHQCSVAATVAATADIDTSFDLMER